MDEGQPHTDSWYAASANRDLSFPRLEGDREVDVCIIGGGYTGLSSAIHLRRRGYSVILLEANKVGWGAELVPIGGTRMATKRGPNRSNIEDKKEALEDRLVTV